MKSGYLTSMSKTKVRWLFSFTNAAWSLNLSTGCKVSFWQGLTKLDRAVVVSHTKSYILWFCYCWRLRQPNCLQSNMLFRNFCLGFKRMGGIACHYALNTHTINNGCDNFYLKCLYCQLISWYISPPPLTMTAMNRLDILVNF